MSLYQSAVKKPVTTALIFVAIAVFGIFSLVQIPINLYPEFDANTIMVITSYNGASAADIENNVTKPLENTLNGVNNLKHITSSSKENVSVITLEFEYGIDIDVATNDVRDKLEMVKSSLPDDSDTPIIFKFGADDIPILLLSVTARESMPGLYKILDDKVSNPLARIGGVGTVSVSGVPEREIKVYVDPYKIYISDNLHYVKPKVRYLHLMRCGFARIGRSQKFGFHCWIPPFDWSCQSRFCLFPFVKHLMDYTMAILLKKDGTDFPVAYHLQGWIS